MTPLSLRMPQLRAPRCMAFWHVGPSRLVAAVLERTAEEPLLTACASVRSEHEVGSANAVAPGVLELARTLGALRLPHAAALDERFCRVVSGASTRGEDRAGRGQEDADTVRVAIVGIDDAYAEASTSALSDVVASFVHARLDLRALDCAACATLNLAAFLGQSEGACADPLAAVSVAPECEASATALGALLAAPVGLALVRFGLLGDA